MKKLCRVLSVLMCAALLLGAVSVSAFAAENKTYLVLGDSIGVGLGIANPDEACYGRIIANTNGYNYYNDAVSGYRSDDLLGHLYRTDVASHVRAADIISISIGGNDFLRNNYVGLIAQASVGDFRAVDEAVNGVRTNFDSIMARIRKLNPSALILMQTLYNPQDSNPALKATYAKTVARLNAVFTDYDANHPGEIEIVDVAKAFEGKVGLIAADTIHPSAEGNLVIARAVQAKLYALGVANASQITVVTEPRDHGEIVSRKTVFERIKDFFIRLAAMIRQLFKA